MQRLILTLATLLVALPVMADTTAKLEAAMTAETRGDKDRARDANRMPVETLAFFGFRDDMRVLELFPGRGWYTHLLAPVLADDGEYFAALGTRSIAENLLTQPGFEKATVLDIDVEFERVAPFNLNRSSEYTLGINALDMVLTFRNLHNFDAGSRKIMHEAVFSALKSGGVYGVVDHTARHNEPINNDNRRRLDPVTAIAEIQAAGFVLDGVSDLHYRPQDNLTLEVGNEAVTGQTDRFTLRFVKP